MSERTMFPAHAAPARRARLAFVLPLGAALLVGGMADAVAQTRGEGGMRGQRYGNHHNGGGGGRAVGAGIAGAIIGIGAGIAAAEASRERRYYREETVLEEYEVRPRRPRADRPRRAQPGERVVYEPDDGSDEPREPRRPRKPKTAKVKVVEPNLREPTRTRPKIARETPAKPERPAADRPRPDRNAPAPAVAARSAPPAATPPVAPLAAPPPPVVPPVAAAADDGRVPNEVLCEVRSGATDAEIRELGQRQRLDRISAEKFELTGSTVIRYRIADDRPIDAAVSDLENDPLVVTAQPNNAFTLSKDEPSSIAATQYAVAKLRLKEAHATASGTGVAIAVIDSEIDATHPALKGVVVESFDPIGGEFRPHAHGTAVASLAAGRGDMASPAPGAEIYAIRAFAPDLARKPGAQGTTMHILRGLDWAAQRGAKVVNMSFAGPKDAKIAEFIAAGAAKGAIHVAAAGNAGPSSPPLYPAADPNVIAVTATDADDRLLKVANRGDHVAVSAPGVDVLVATPGGGFGYLTGTSMASAGVSGLIALMAEAKPGLALWQARAALTGSAHDLGKPGPDAEFGAGLADARGALDALGSPEDVPVAQAGETEPVAAASATTQVSAEPATVAQRP